MALTLRSPHTSRPGHRRINAHPSLPGLPRQEARFSSTEQDERDKEAERLRRRHRAAGERAGLFITPWVPFEVGVLHKENLVVRDYEGYEGFNHLIVRLRHPDTYDPRKPEILLVPGILCNGNLFRLSWTGGSFKDLNHPHSFANALAFEGYSVVIIHPRDSQWIYTRYAGDVLGIPNTFSPSFSIEDGVEDLCFCLETCLKLRKKENASEEAVFVGFSLGGIKLIDMLGTRKLNDAIRGLVFLSTPVEFETNREKLIPLLRIYTQIARFLPIEHYSALNIIDRNVIIVKKLAKKILGDTSPRLAGEIIKRVPLMSDVFHVKDPDFDLEMLLPMISYVLEPVSSTIMKELLYAVREGRLIKQGSEDDCLELLPSTIPPWLSARGTEDRIVTPDSHRILDATLKYRNKNGHSLEVPGLGHDDTVVSRDVCQEVIRFLRTLS